jgi:hypothetical protein
MSGQEMSRLVAILADGIRVLVKRGDAELTEDQVFERARNQAQAVMGEYMLIRRPELDEAVTPVAAIGHGYGCPCGRCPGEFRVVVTSTQAGTIKGPSFALRDERPAGVVPYHGWSCQCTTCHAAKQKERS